MSEIKAKKKSKEASFRLKWKNIYSGDTGFVKAIKEAKQHFENGSLEEARKFRSKGECTTAISTLQKIGEAENNAFIITDSEGREVV